jgi:hypothetical protein
VQPSIEHRRAEHEQVADILNQMPVS